MTDTKNTVGDERLAIKGEGFDTQSGGFAFIHVGDRRYAKAEVINALRASIPGGVGVKGLCWKANNYGAPEAASVAGTYRITDAWSGGFNLNRGQVTFQCEDGRTNFPSIEAAKAAAQADYERRILSALDLSPAEGEPVAWRYKHNGFGEWFISADGPKVRGFKAAYGCEVQPLYAAPSNPVISDEMVERLARELAADEMLLVGRSRAVRDSMVSGIWRDEAPRARQYLTAALSVKPQSGSGKP